MACSTFRSELGGPGIVRFVLAAACVVLSGGGLDSLAAVPAGAWEFGGRLEVGGGWEDEALTDPEVQRAAVPGGGFGNLSPNVTAARLFGDRGSLVLSGAGSLDRYGDGGRQQLAVAGWGELTLRSARRAYGRLLVGGDRFDDSSLDTSRRSGAAARAAFGFSGGRSGIELIAGGGSRRYPDLVVEDAAGIPGTYRETTSEAGLAAFGLAGRGVQLRGEAILRNTSARDPLFDARAGQLRGLARIGGRGAWTGWVTAVFERREFAERDPGADRDDYLQVVIRVERELRGRLGAGLVYGLVRYAPASGATETANRFAVVLTRRFGRDAARPSPVVSGRRESAGRVDPEVDGDSARFSIRAPEARRVSLVGDFNGWDREAHPMTRTTRGGWEIVLDLPPGYYQYAYVVDGAWTEPAHAERLVADGFGGQNGLFEVPR